MKLSDLNIISNKLSNIPLEKRLEKMNTLLIELGYDPNHVYQELEMSSNYIDTHEDISYSNTNIQLHSHNFYELLYCRNTCDAEYLVDSQRYKLQKGDIILIPPGVSHQPILNESLNQPYIRDVLWMSKEFINNMIIFYDSDFLYSKNHYILRTSNTKYEYLGELFHQGVKETNRKDFGYETAIIGNTILLITHLIRALSDKKHISLKAEKPQLFDEITNYIENNYNKKLSLHEISNKFYISESSINLLFKEKMNTSFYRYVTLRRLIQSKQLILKNDIPLEEVASLVGFHDYSTFYKAFKKEYGISPRKFRSI